MLVDAFTRIHANSKEFSFRRLGKRLMSRLSRRQPIDFNPDRHKTLGFDVSQTLEATAIYLHITVLIRISRTPMVCYLSFCVFRYFKVLKVIHKLIRAAPTSTNTSEAVASLCWMSRGNSMSRKCVRILVKHRAYPTVSATEAE